MRPTGPSPGTKRQRLGGSGRKRSRAAPRPSRGGPCWLATARSAAERRRQKCGPPGPARERRNQRLGDSGRSGVELRRAPPGAGRASWRPPAAQRSGGGRSAAHRARPGHEETAARRQRSEAESSCAAPRLGRAVLVGDRPRRSGAAAAEVQPTGPSPGTGRRSPCIIQRRLPGEASGSCGLGAGAATLACGAGAGGLAAPTGRVVSITVESPAEEAASATSAGEVHGDDTCEADKLRLRRAARGSRRW